MHQSWGMDLENINRRHLVETDMYYRVGMGLTSRLLGYDKGIIKLEVIINKKWQKNHNATALEIAHCWKDNNIELNKAVGSKVYIIDTGKYNYKQYLIHRGIKPGYDAQKGILFKKNLLN